ncbi:hypothetical protein D3C72_2225620 [compost metagenome]
MAVLRLLPANHLTRVLHKDFALCNILHRKHPFAMDARAPRLDAAALHRVGGRRRCGAGHGKNSVNLIVHTHVCVRVYACTCA